MFNCTTPSIDDIECSQPYANLNDSISVLEEICIQSSGNDCIYNFNQDYTLEQIQNFKYNDKCDEIVIYTPTKQYRGNKASNLYEVCNEIPDGLILKTNANLAGSAVGSYYQLDLLSSNWDVKHKQNFDLLNDGNFGNLSFINQNEGLYLVSFSYLDMFGSATYDFPTKFYFICSNNIDFGRGGTTTIAFEFAQIAKEFPTQNNSAVVGVAGAPYRFVNKNISASALVYMTFGQYYNFSFGNTNATQQLITIGTGSTISILKVN